MTMRIPGLFIVIALLACACAGGAGGAGGSEPLDPVMVSAGRDVALLRCSRCHALDKASHSPDPSAPPMSGLLDRYDAEMLASDLIDGIRVGHDQMPEFDLQVIEADALVAYLKSLRSP